MNRYLRHQNYFFLYCVSTDPVVGSNWPRSTTNTYARSTRDSVSFGSRTTPVMMCITSLWIPAKLAPAGLIIHIRLRPRLPLPRARHNGTSTPAAWQRRNVVALRKSEVFRRGKTATTQRRGRGQTGQSRAGPSARNDDDAATTTTSPIDPPRAAASMKSAYPKAGEECE